MRVAQAGDAPDQPDDETLLRFFRAIASGELREVSGMLASRPELAVAAIKVAATRQNAETYLLTAIRHYVYAGDTGLHMAAAAYQRSTAETLVANGARVGARNRRGAEPLHYAADGAPGGPSWDPGAQQSVIEYLLTAGADPDAYDDSGVAPLHRAVRTRSSAAVRALLELGADARLMNKRGSTPLHLAVQSTGRSDSGSVDAKDQQRQIVALLLQHGARPDDTDSKGKTVEAAATSDWIRALLSSCSPEGLKAADGE
jgi:Ankyrin repeats (3 copies)